MQNFIYELNVIIAAAKQNFGFVLMLLAILWLIQFINAVSRYRLNYLGVFPRRLSGLPGIIFYSFLHGSFEHLFMNSMALFILLNLVLLYGMHTFVVVSVIIILLSGVLLWLFGRPSIHIGASGLVMGYWGFVLFGAYHEGTVLAILIALICLYYLRGLFVNLFPAGKSVSWEGHVFGFLAGISASYLVEILPK
ncbi:MAG: rhomboid family intramembrane serine protease [Gammaproteobacteria bacterium]|nr:rhomboid family intramembrane serine protease [Gammaproteobacteria bacterium]MCH9744678.1 rhomboid family intramembrane serine protease [Gammaproteobacteria bacterium]